MSDSREVSRAPVGAEDHSPRVFDQGRGRSSPNPPFTPQTRPPLRTTQQPSPPASRPRPGTPRHRSPYRGCRT